MKFTKYWATVLIANITATLSGCMIAYAPSTPGRDIDEYVAVEVCLPNKQAMAKGELLVYRTYFGGYLPYFINPKAQTITGQSVSGVVGITGIRKMHGALAVSLTQHPDKVYMYALPNWYPTQWGAWTPPTTMEPIRVPEIDHFKYFRGKPPLSAEELRDAPRIRLMATSRKESKVTQEGLKPKPAC